MPYDNRDVAFRSEFGNFGSLTGGERERLLDEHRQASLDDLLGDRRVRPSRRRDELKEHLAARGVGSAVYYPRPLHLQPCFAHLGYREGAFPQAEQACQEVLSLPVYPELDDAQVDAVVEGVKEFYG